MVYPRQFSAWSLLVGTLLLCASRPSPHFLPCERKLFLSHSSLLTGVFRGLIVWLVIKCYLLFLAGPTTLFRSFTKCPVNLLHRTERHAVVMHTPSRSTLSISPEGAGGMTSPLMSMFQSLPSPVTGRSPSFHYIYRHNMILNTQLLLQLIRGFV